VCHARGVGKLLLLFILVPAIELGLLIEAGSRIGTPATLGLIVITGVVGAALARREGLRVLARVQSELAAGVVPGDAVLDALMILVAGALLVTPGILTDVVGFLCLVPVFRSLVKRLLARRFEAAVAAGRVHVTTAGSGFENQPRSPERPIIDITPKD